MEEQANAERDWLTVFRTDEGNEWLHGELAEGRLRQGWGAPGLDLTSALGHPVEKGQWEAAHRGWADWRDPSPRRFSILRRMLELDCGDVVVIPKMPTWKSVHDRSRERSLPFRVGGWEAGLRPCDSGGSRQRADVRLRRVQRSASGVRFVRPGEPPASRLVLLQREAPAGGARFVGTGGQSGVEAASGTVGSGGRRRVPGSGGVAGAGCEGVERTDVRGCGSPVFRGTGLRRAGLPALRRRRRRHGHGGVAAAEPARHVPANRDRCAGEVEAGRRRGRCVGR